MRIGYLYGTNTYPPRSGGSIHVYNLVKHLTARGHEVHSLGEETNPLCTVHPAEDVTGFLDAIDVLYVRIDGWFLRQSRLKLACLDAAGGLPAVWEINAPAAEALATAEFGRPTALGRNRRGLRKLVRDKRREGRLRRLVMAEEETRRSYAATARAAICVSEPLAAYAREDLGIARAVTIPNGSDPDLFGPHRAEEGLLPDASFKVVYAGNSRWPWQGIGLVTETAARAEGEDILFVVLDNSPEETATPPASNIHVLRRVDYERAPAYLASADVALCLYHDFGWLKHGFHLSPLKLFDYLASGTPVIGSDLGQIAEIIGDGTAGWLTPNDPAAIHGLIGEAMNDPAATDARGRAARDKVLDSHTWAHVAAATEEVLRDAAS